MPLLDVEPVPTLLKRVRGELAADFGNSRPIRVSRAPGRLDVMGGIADYTGSLVCELPLDRAAAVAVCPRDDRQIQVISLNLHDENKPFTLRMPLDALAKAKAEDLRREFDEPGRKWAAYLVGCLFVLHEQNLIDLREHGGINVALYSTVPLGAGVSSSAAIEVATMMNMLGPDLLQYVDPMRVASLSQQVENRIVGAPCGIMDQVTSVAGQSGSLLRLLCQPHELQPPLRLPEGTRVLGINSNVKHSVGGGAYGRTRCAAFMAHKMILELMRNAGTQRGLTLERDPMNGYLANLDGDDYKHYFRPRLPEWMKGQEFLDKYGGTIDTATTVDADTEYPVQHAADHHVLEARRVRHFAECIEGAAKFARGTRDQGFMLDKAGHLMYASHLSYTNDAMLGAPECDLLVDLVRKHERAGLYGAKITGGGSGGTVAILADDAPRADAAIAQIMETYKQQTGHNPELFSGSSDGAWTSGTAMAT
jgi:galactokinase